MKIAQAVNKDKADCVQLEKQQLNNLALGTANKFSSKVYLACLYPKTNDNFFFCRASSRDDLPKMIKREGNGILNLDSTDRYGTYSTEYSKSNDTTIYFDSYKNLKTHFRFS